MDLVNKFRRIIPILIQKIRGFSKLDLSFFKKESAEEGKEI